MSKCKNCGRHGFFLMVNVRTGLCADCQEKLMNTPVEPSKPTERNIEIPTVYIGNYMKSRLSKQIDDFELQCPDSLPDFSKIDCCDNVEFVIENNLVIAKHLSETLGFVNDELIASEIILSIEKKRPIFAQILGYDDETGEIHLVIAFYKIINYDYDLYAQNNDDSLDDENVAYF